MDLLTLMGLQLRYLIGLCFTGGWVVGLHGWLTFVGALFKVFAFLCCFSFVYDLNHILY